MYLLIKFVFSSDIIEIIETLLKTIIVIEFFEKIKNLSLLFLYFNLRVIFSNIISKQ